ncbi:hypothetical protein [Hydrogenophaga sp.]|uniref:hypothetical protein n=2 Tax=Hydrogenophaga sp. TaxID=1904254 RepID=UPI0025C2C5B1|nr:hypothetical protein [Hydrogenophaga sp.]
MSVYLGAGRALVVHPSKGEMEVVLPSTRPLIDLLDAVDLQTGREQDRPWTVDLHPGTALCPAVAVSLPRGLKRVDEAMTVVRALALQAMGFAADEQADLRCALPVNWAAGRSVVCAAMAAGTHDLLLDWSQRHGGRVGALRPMWSRLTRPKPVPMGWADALRFEQYVAHGVFDATAQDSVSLDIDFLALQRQATRRRLALVASLLTLVGIGIADVWLWRDVGRLQAEVAALEADVNARRAAARVEPAPLTEAQAKALKALSWDWNRVYGPLESIEIPGVRVISLDVDAMGGHGRVEFHMPDETSILAITEGLNDSAAQVEWRLQSVNRVGGGAPAGGGVRAVWTGVFK